MKNFFGVFGFIALASIIGFSTTGCRGRSGVQIPAVYQNTAYTDGLEIVEFGVTSYGIIIPDIDVSPPHIIKEVVDEGDYWHIYAKSKSEFSFLIEEEFYLKKDGSVVSTKSDFSSAWKKR